MMMGQTLRAHARSLPISVPREKGTGVVDSGAGGSAATSILSPRKVPRHLRDMS